LNAQNNTNIAMVNLNVNMGITDAPDYQIEGTLSFEKDNIALNDAIQQAFANRQDLKSIYFQETAAQYNETLARTGYYPSIGGSVEYSWAGYGSPFNSNNGWTGLLTLSVPIFDGYLTKYKINEAQANLDVLKS